jgi:predicted RNA-binding Zn-ribbon protein involved in translation (DUF1610 family)
MDKEPTQGPAPAQTLKPLKGKDETMEQKLLEWAASFECPSCGTALKTSTAKLNCRARVFTDHCSQCKGPVTIKAKNWTGEKDEGARNMIVRTIIRWLARRLLIKVALVGGFVGGVATGVAYPEQSALAGAALKAAWMYFWT